MKKINKYEEFIDLPIGTVLIETYYESRYIYIIKITNSKIRFLGDSDFEDLDYEVYLDPRFENKKYYIANKWIQELFK